MLAPRRVVLGTAFSLLGLLAAWFIYATLTSKANSGNGDLESFVKIGHEAIHRSQAVFSNPVLRHVTANAGQQSYRFSFTEATGRQWLTVSYVPDSSRDDWEVVLSDFSALGGSKHEGINLRALQVSPEAAGQAATDYWGKCEPYTLILFGEGEELTWRVVCDTHDGEAVGVVDNDTGKFSPTRQPGQIAPTPTPPPVHTDLYNQ